GAGEVWQDLVSFCVEHEYAGIENLSLIPGSVGAAPIQNIGAYGVELKDVFHSLEAFDTETGAFRKFNRGECGFAYRESVFKNRFRGRYIITSVRLMLSEIFRPDISYGAIAEELRKRNILKPGIRDISRVVSAIRVSKLPDPSTIGNAGSFFKNPVIGASEFEALRKKFPDAVSFSMSGGNVKLSGGWLIEKCGWKGKVLGNTGTWKNQALVLVNHGQATGKEIFDFSEAIIRSVEEKFGIRLEREVNIV
ncbi:MAG TPA: UDP-N-acetylmuramate dehydrogenase, partial [Anseongella sp.]|nr:UDP-N-acetylmuramate dehydrogenase [Anseongella sp.]